MNEHLPLQQSSRLWRQPDALTYEVNRMTATTRTVKYLNDNARPNRAVRTQPPLLCATHSAGLLITIIEGPAAAQRGDDRSRQSVRRPRTA